MKKGKVFGKKQLLLAGMVVALAGAVWLNMEYSGGNAIGEADSSSPTASYLGQAQYVNSTIDSETAPTGAKVEDSSYFEKTRKERNATREDAIEELDETVADAKISDDIKAEAVAKMTELAARMDTEASIEALLKAKGFSDVLAVIGDNDINVVIKVEKLLESEIIQIQDIATSQSGLPLDKVKIITVK